MCPACIASLALWVGGGATASSGLAALLLVRRNLLVRRKRPGGRAMPATAPTENPTTKERL